MADQDPDATIIFGAAVTTSRSSRRGYPAARFTEPCGDFRHPCL